MTLYLDHAATTPLRPEAREAMTPFEGEYFGNPSGIHSVSQRAKNAVEEAREQAAEILGAARALEIVFTSGGTEADNLAIAGVALTQPGSAVVSVATEHKAVLETLNFVDRLGHPVTIMSVDRSGRVEPGEVAAATSGATSVVSVMAANNETGVVQPIKKVGEAIRAVDPGLLLHTDAVQAFNSEDVTVAGTGADLISLSAHKFGGPKGVGLLYVRDGIELEPVIHGGGQEMGRRAGTHNVAGILGMVAAMQIASKGRADFRTQTGSIRDAFEGRLFGAVPDAIVNAPFEERLPQHSHVRIPGVVAETLLIRLDAAGIAAAAGSACQSGAIEVSHVLAAMGMTRTAATECVRFTFGWTSALDDALLAADALIELVGELR